MRVGIGLLVLAALAPPASRPAPIVLGYYPSWVAHPTVKEIKIDRFTHLAHAFLQADDEGNLKSSRAIPSRELPERAHEHGVKVLLSLGGARSAKPFRRIAHSAETRERYAAAVVRAATENGYDGIDLDWEPTEGDEDRQGVVLLVRALKSAWRWNTCTLMITRWPAGPAVAESTPVSALPKSPRQPSGAKTGFIRALRKTGATG